jgi:hypothetical protein
MVLPNLIHEQTTQRQYMYLVRYRNESNVTYGRFYTNRGMSSLLGNDPVNILAETNTDNTEYIVITRC